MVDDGTLAAIGATIVGFGIVAFVPSLLTLVRKSAPISDCPRADLIVQRPSNAREEGVSVGAWDQLCADTSVRTQNPELPSRLLGVRCFGRDGCFWKLFLRSR
jgi:hypothetical protein